MIIYIIYIINNIYIFIIYNMITYIYIYIYIIYGFYFEQKEKEDVSNIGEMIFSVFSV